MRSASSFALRSISSKSSASPPATTFFAPRPFFFAPRMLALGRAVVAVLLRTADAGTARGAAVDSVPAESGDFERVVPLPLEEALRKGEAVRLPEAGVPVRDGGLLGRLMVGLSQDEKKSSSSAAGVLEPEVSGSGTSVMTTSSGYLTSQRPLSRRGHGDLRHTASCRLQPSC